MGVIAGVYDMWVKCVGVLRKRDKVEFEFDKYGSGGHILQPVSSR